jgi:hypothetical protein
MLKWLKRFFVCAAIFGALFYLLYPRRFQITARMWHWKHGNVVRLRNWEFSLPRDWYVEDEPLNSIDFRDAGFTSPGRPLGGFTSIDVWYSHEESINLDYVRTAERQRFAKSGVTDIEENTLHFGNETVVCVGGDFLQTIVHVPLPNWVSLDCSTSDGLHLMFIGFRADLPSFYEFVPQIRKVNDAR